MARASATNLIGVLLATSLPLLGSCETISSPANTPRQEPAKNEAPPPPTPPTVPEQSSSGLSKVGELEFLEFTTAGAPADAPLPMLVAIHGLGDEPVNFSNLLRDLSVPARVIVPRGIDTYEPGWSWFPLRARDPDVDALAEGMMVAADLIAKSVESLAAQRPTQGKPVVTGFSQGGMLSFALATKHGQLFSAAVPVSGWLPPPLWPDAGTPAATIPPVIALHGTEDPALRYSKTVECIEVLTKRGVEASLIAYPGVPHVITPQMRSELHRQLAAAVKTQAAATVPPAH